MLPNAGVVAPAAAVVQLHPGDDVQAQVSAAAPGTAFLLKAGLYRLQAIEPKDGDTFTGEPGTVLSGARLLTSFRRSGRYWVAEGQTQEGTRLGRCRVDHPRCAFPEDLFVDNERLVHVDSLGDVGPGTWHFDYGADRIYLGNDPIGHVVETTVTPHAFMAHGRVISGVTITGLVIEKYASPGNTGAVSAPNGHLWIVSDNDIRWNHATGVTVGDGSRVIRNTAHHNGQAGIGAYDAPDILIENNELSYNGALFDPFWSAAGLKVVLLSKTVIRGNFSHHNFGGGLWCDVDCRNVLIENNLVEDNEQFGISYEISFDAVIRNNMIHGNGFGVREGPAQAGIFVSASKNVEIYGNTVTGNASGIVGYQERRGASVVYRQPYEIENLNVHDNTISMTTGITGLIQTVGDATYYTSRNNRFVENHYQLGSGTQYFVWMDANRTEAQWQNYRQDIRGTFARPK